MHVCLVKTTNKRLEKTADPRSDFWRHYSQGHRIFEFAIIFVIIVIFNFKVNQTPFDYIIFIPISNFLEVRL
jgi:hypothetical protein